MSKLQNLLMIFLLLTLTGAVPIARGSADPVFSGPQVGEKITTFKVIDPAGPAAGREREFTPAKEPAVVLVFVGTIERSIVPLLTVIDEYGFDKRDLLKTEFVFLGEDRVALANRVPAVAQSLRLKCPASISNDGAEGPGNYGLNKSVLMTIVVAKEGRVTANFALVQPGMADAPAVIAAIAKAVGDSNPPKAETLRDHRTGGAASRPGGAASRPGGAPMRTQRPNLPGAAPTDEKLIGLLRSFIQKDNDDATIDRIAGQVEAYVKDDPALRKQAVDGWTRVLYLKYGTDHAQNAGQALVERLKK
jgi:hypothetical protein